MSPLSTLISPREDDNPLPLRVKGGKPFSVFSRLEDDDDALRKTWRIASKVANELEHGHRIENMSWRMWHLQEVIESTEAKARGDASIRKIGTSIGRSLESDKKKSITEMEASVFKWSDANDAIRHLGMIRLQKRDAAKKLSMKEKIRMTKPAKMLDQHSKDEKSQPRRSSRKQHESHLKGTLNKNEDRADDTTSGSSSIDSSGSKSNPNKIERLTKRSMTESALNRKAADSDDSGSASSSGSASTSLHHSRKRLRNGSSNITQLPAERKSSSPPVCWQLTQAAAKKRLQKQKAETAGAEKSKESARIATEKGEKRVGKDQGVVRTRSPMWTLEDIEAAESELIDKGVDLSGPLSAMLADLKGGSLARFQLSSDATFLNRHHKSLNSPGDQIPRSTQQYYSQLQSQSFASPPHYHDSPSSTYTVPVQMPILNNLEHGFSLPTSPSTTCFTNHNSLHQGNGDYRQQIGSQGPQSGPARLDHRRSHSTFAQSMYIPSRHTPSAHMHQQNHQRLQSNSNTVDTIKIEEQDESSSVKVVISNGKSQARKAQCANCGATSTPLWRRDANFELQCNACGLYYKLHHKPRPVTLKHRRTTQRKASPSESNRIVKSPPSRRSSDSSESASCEWLGIHAGASCANCGTTTTPLWRKDADNRVICNACGLYSKMHNADRPVQMRIDKIRRRSRNDDRQKRTLEQSENTVHDGEPSLDTNTPLQQSHSQTINSSVSEQMQAPTAAVQIPAQLWDNHICPMGAWGENCCQNLPQPPDDISQEQLLQQQAILEQFGLSTSSFDNLQGDASLLTSPSNQNMGSMDVNIMASILGEDWLIDYPSAPANTPGAISSGAIAPVDTLKGKTNAMTEVVGPSHQIKRRKTESTVSPAEWWTVPATQSSSLDTSAPSILNHDEYTLHHQQEK